jgi:hypothetical protein
MPALVQNYKRKEATVRLKKSYSSMTQAILMAQTEHGDLQFSTYAPVEVIQDFFLTYLAPYLKYSETRVEPTDIVPVSASLPSEKKFFIYFHDGSRCLLYSGSEMDVIFDINGPKPPNQWGVDLFDFLYVKSEKRLRPYKVFATRAAALTECAQAPTGNTGAKTCTGLLSFDNYEFEDDYPWKF